MTTCFPDVAVLRYDLAATSNWRRAAAQWLTQEMDFGAYGIKGVYLIGSAETGEVGPCSDIDLIIHTDDDAKHDRLGTWLESWDRALCRLNQRLTGYACPHMLDIHYVTPRDVREKTSFAVRMTSLYEPPELLRRENPPKDLHPAI